jgi:propanol-preferring alcohol dehydrogenase
MRAAILENEKLVLKDVPKPSPGHEEALVRMTTAGVCHSDVHLVKGDWPGYVPGGTRPMGHEGIGIVEELGAGADKSIQKGDRVILGLGGAGGQYWCGACEYCLSGRTRLCKQLKRTSGTYAEYISVWAKALVKLPPEVSNNEVSLACGGLTAYGALKKVFNFGVSPGKPIAIVGAAGGLGHYAVQIAKSFGYKVIGVDVGQEKIEFVKKLGADYAVDVSESEKFITEKLGGAYASVVFATVISAFNLGLKLLTRGGLLVAVGIPPVNEGTISIVPMELIRKDAWIVGSAVGTVEDMRELVQLAAEGKIKTHVSRVAPLSQIHQVLKELEEGKYPGRALINDMIK